MMVIAVAVIYFWGGLRYGLIGLKLMGVSVSDAKTTVEILQSFIQIVAIVVAGVWTYEKFIKDKEDLIKTKEETREEYCSGPQKLDKKGVLLRGG